MSIRGFCIASTAFAVVALGGCDGVDTPTEPVSEVDPPTGLVFALGTPDVENNLTPYLLTTASGIVADGVGLTDETEGSISVDVPAGATVVQALLYWEARMDDADHSEIEVAIEGGAFQDIIGDYIGLSANDVGNPDWWPDSHSFRADLTVDISSGPGTKSVDVRVPADLGFNGASLLILYDDGTEGSIEIRDGDDFAFDGPGAAGQADVHKFTQPQTFTFAPHSEIRQATLWLLVADVEDARPTRIAITVDGVMDNRDNELGEGALSWDGDEWDTWSGQVTIPAGVGEITVQLISYDDATDKIPASLAWVAAGLEVPIPRQGGGEGCTPGYWKQRHHFDSWTAPYDPSDLFSSAGFDNAFPGKTLLEVLKTGGGGLKALGRHTVAAMLNAASADVSYDVSVAGVIDAFNDVYPGSKGDYNGLKDEFEDFNEQGCPLN